ncbi:ATPdependent RNA helicase [Homalodisca vitripennis]|nr:ATPdependent RNA helicase [Homalodisca vitripennis]
MAQEKDSFTLNIGVDTSSNIRREQSEKNKRKLPKKKGQSKAKRKITNDEDSESDYETYKKLKISNDKSKQTQYVSSLFGHNPEIPSLESKDVSPVCEEVFSNDTFKEFSNVHAFTIKTLEESFGVTKATVVQQLALPVLMSGKDALVRSQTGSGKTLAYAVPIVEALHRVRPKLTRTDGIKAVVVLPTRELALQTYQCFELLVKSFKWLVPGLVVGGEKRKSEKARLRKGINILVGTPGRINDHVSHTQALKLDCVQWLVLDEADRLLDLGYEREITSLVKQLDGQSQERRQTVLLSATLTARVEQLAGLALTAPVRLDASQARDSELVIPQSLSQHYIVTPAKLRLVSLAAFIHWKCQVVREGKMLVFMATQDMVDYHTELLSTVLTDTAEFLRLHGSMTQHERTQVFQTFKAADSGVLLCTEVTPWGDQLGVTPAPTPCPHQQPACCPLIHSFMSLTHSFICNSLTLTLIKMFEKSNSSDDFKCKGAEQSRDIVLGYKEEGCVLISPNVRCGEGEGKPVFSPPPSDTRSRQPHPAPPAPLGSLTLFYDVAARGLDLPSVDWIVQYTSPATPEDYVHRVGRTARVGHTGSAILFLVPSELGFVAQLQDKRLKLKEEQMYECLQSLESLQWEDDHRRSSGMEGAATFLQLRFETAVLEQKNLHNLACKAYVSWVRFYSSYPKEARECFNFKELHLGHFAKSFALRDPPTSIGGVGRPNFKQANQNRSQKVCSLMFFCLADDKLDFDNQSSIYSSTKCPMKRTWNFPQLF